MQVKGPRPFGREKPRIEGRGREACDARSADHTDRLSAGPDGKAEALQRYGDAAQALEAVALDPLALGQVE